MALSLARTTALNQIHLWELDHFTIGSVDSDLNLSSGMEILKTIAWRSLGRRRATGRTKLTDIVRVCLRLLQWVQVGPLICGFLSILVSSLSTHTPKALSYSFSVFFGYLFHAEVCYVSFNSASVRRDLA